MKQGHWAHTADEVLAEIFVRGRPAPTREQLRDAYPFSERRYWPYKVWLRQVKVWRLAHSLGLSSPSGQDVRVRSRLGKRDTATLDAFVEVPQ